MQKLIKMADEEDASNSQIIEYIKELGYTESVLKKVEESKVSGETISMFVKEDFVRMGLALAHAYQVMSKFKLCKDTQQTKRLTSLLHAARSRHESHKGLRKRAKPPDISVVFNWYNYDKKKNKYTQVREVVGGGRRVQVLPRHSNLQQLTEVAKELFFPSGKSVRDWKLSDCTYYIGDFALNKIDDNGFILEEYKNLYSLKQCKLSLMTKKMTTNERIQNIIALDEQASDDDLHDFDLPSYPSLSRINSISTFADFPLPTSSSTPELVERRSLIQEQDEAFENSLKADQEKDKVEVMKLERTLNDTAKELQVSAQQRADKLKKQIMDLQEKESIRKARLDRLPMEPGLSDDHVMICVHHITFGRIQRTFYPTDKVQTIYDWIGSLCHDPLYFRLSTQFSNTTLSPDEPIKLLDKTVLIMTESDQPVENSPDESITFAGHHAVRVNTEELYRKVESKRTIVHDTLCSILKTIYVSRSGVLDDMMSIYIKDDELMKHKIVVHFENGLASGDGVAREAFSLFIDELLLKSCEGTEQFVPIVQPEFSASEFQVVGSIIYHFFVNFGLFPTHFARASMEYVFNGKCGTTVLLESFFAFISKSDADVLSKAIYSDAFVLSDVVAALSKYGIRTLANKQNICELVCKAARNELIVKPLPALQAIRNSFGTFFDDFDSEGIGSIYEVATPSNAKVKAYMNYPDPIDRMEENAFGYMERFISEANQSVLQDFLKFTSGSSYILPGARIKVTSEIMSELQSRPIAKTCIKLLTIPRNMLTYHAFQKNMQFYIGHTDYWAMED